MNTRFNLQATRLLRSSAFLAALFILAAGAGSQLARAQSAVGAPEGSTATGGRNPTGSSTSGSHPSGSTTELSPDELEFLRQRFNSSSTSWPPSSFQPESPESIARKLQTGEYHIDRNEKPAWYWIGKLALLVVTVSMFIVSLVVRLTARKPQAGGTPDEMRKADGLAEAARAKYKNLVRQASRKAFVEQRAALATEGAATENLFRQAAEQYRSVSEKFDQAADPKNPSAAAQASLQAKAYAEQAAAQTALADIAALYRDPTVTSPEEFTRRAERPAAIAQAAAEKSRQLRKQAGR